MEIEASNHSIGQAIRRLRVGRGWSQAKFAKEVLRGSGDHAFKTVSKIEKGLQALSDEDRKRIEEFFAISLRELVQEQATGDVPRLLRLLGDDEYFREHAEFIDDTIAAAKELPISDLTKAPVEVFFFHPTPNLPVLQRRDVKERWVNNLVAGVNKHLVWPLMFARKRTLRMYLGLAEELLREVEQRKAKQPGVSGSIYFWALKTSDIGEEVETFFERQAQEHAPIEPLGLRFAPPVDALATEATREALTLRSVILNKSNVPGIASYSAIHVHKVCASPGDEVISGWQYYGPEMHAWLEELADDLLEQLRVARDLTAPRL